MVSTLSGTPDPGQPAPDFTLVSSTGQKVSLSDFRGKKNVVVYFMREFSCAQCQQHVIHLKMLYPDLEDRDVEVLVIGGGNSRDAARLARTFDVPFTVLADPDRAVYMQYNLDKMIGLIQRSATVLVDKQGIIRYLHRATNPNNSLDQVQLMGEVGRL
jgi:thioredoxin-dependent peroxiredoxin